MAFYKLSLKSHKISCPLIIIKFKGHKHCYFCKYLGSYGLMLFAFILKIIENKIFYIFVYNIFYTLIRFWDRARRWKLFIINYGFLNGFFKFIYVTFYLLGVTICEYRTPVLFTIKFNDKKVFSNHVYVGIKLEYVSFSGVFN